MTSERVFIVHGWGDKPTDHWIPWLKAQLEERGLFVSAPAMPNPETPRIEEWVSHLDREVGEVGPDTYYVGHSIGCQTILRHLQRSPGETRARGAAMVAPWFVLTGQSDAEDVIARPWIDTPIDFARVRRRLPNLTAFFSDDDPWVPGENQSLFEQRLAARSRLLHGHKHLGVESGMTVFPELLAVTLNGPG